ncbi:MAG TPA: hypothetical protein P5210_04095 [Draconibacterium sp.]|nr:hypothetical protein [Draconibacterium sp.]HRX10807.1 hypothetical protein [Draconibacterium sp.]
MIERLRELFSFYITSPEQKTDNLPNVELVSCPLREIICNVHLTAINNSLLESEKFRKDKDFDNSIETLKYAFKKSTELLNHPCTNCAQHFRTKISESLENIHDELEKKSKGVFRRKKYKLIYNRSKSLLKEIKLDMANDKLKLNHSNKRFLGNHLN